MKKSVARFLCLGMSCAMLAACGQTEKEYSLVPASEDELEDQLDTIKTLIAFEETDYKIKSVIDKSLELGERRIIKRGVRGISEIFYEVSYANGEEVDRKAKSEVLVRKPQDEIIHISEEEARKTGVETYGETDGSSEEDELPQSSKDLRRSNDNSSGQSIKPVRKPQPSKKKPSNNKPSKNKPSNNKPSENEPTKPEPSQSDKEKPKTTDDKEKPGYNPPAPDLPDVTKPDQSEETDDPDDPDQPDEPVGPDDPNPPKPPKPPEDPTDPENPNPPEDPSQDGQDENSGENGGQDGSTGKDGPENNEG